MKRQDKPGRVGGPAGPADDALRRAAAALQNRRPGETERIAREFLARNARHPEALYWLGLALLSQQKPREAIVPLEEAVRQRTDPAIETHLAIALRQVGRTDDALALLERATKRQPPFWLAFHELGVLLFSRRQLTQAETVLRRGIELVPAVPELSVLLGGIFLERADWANAKLAFARVLANVPGHPGALYGAGTALMNDGEFAAAAERLRQVVARDPNYVQAWNDLGLCLLELDQWDEAIACLRRAVATAPGYYGAALKTLVTSGRGRFALKPSAAAEWLRPH